MKNKIYNILVLGMVVMAGGCKQTIKQEATEETPIQSPLTEEVSFTEMEFQERIPTSGTIDVPPANKALVTAMAGGYIEFSPLLVGDQVKKGQLMVTLKNPEFVSLQQSYLEVWGQIPYLEAEQERHKTLFEEGISSKKQYLKSASDYKTAQATLNGLSKQLELLNISVEKVKQGELSTVASVYAPLAGSITQVNVAKGMYVSAATEIFEIVNPDHIHLELRVFEKDILKVKKGQRISFSIPETGEQRYEAEVYLIGTTVNADRTIAIHAHLDDEDQPFLPGMFVEAEIITDAYQAPALPKSVLTEADGGFWVRMKKGGKKAVTIGQKQQGYVEIKNASEFEHGSVFQ
ncbi:efflux RND transporter periplasmic adaptor subunit [Sediminicola luteus]|uniref:Uncharacterized protein n=1 Tax=Sediminicola luteus TaxID=319238 RepID=A0A2A4GC37_9FLAO|nr:efflux RND transporter periplasmic adaptor subunit [Sediminicola luteus]PCE66167.1 hypothetical protein B7P33_02400 [Sediminicola luteus]